MRRMFEWLSEISGNVIERGGPVMWPLGALSLVALTLIFERAWFYVRTNTGARRRRMSKIAQHLRAGQTAEAAAMIRADDSVYGDLVRQLTSERATDAVATDAVERQRPRLERFMPTLGTIITAAPMLGILGTVLGIIGAFDLLGAEQSALKLEAVSGKIAEALITTVAGLIVALVVLFPYNSFRAQIERTLGMMETLITAAQHDAEREQDETHDA